MNKYSDKSDFDINKAVAASLGCTAEYENESVTVFRNNNGGMPLVVSATADSPDNFDPCNNPDDAFPLIIDVKLSIHPDFYNDCESWIVRTVHIPPVKDKSLTRAICIAYLMMKDAENEK